MTIPADNDQTSAAPRWLDEDESQAWLNVWSLMTWLPTRLDAQLRRDSGLSLADYHALSQISMAPDRTLRLRELGRVANMTLSHLSRVISRLEATGWVRRTPDPDDGRSTLATLTEDGMRKVEQAAPGHVEAVRSFVFDPLTREQALALGASAARIVDAIEPPSRARA